MLVFVSRDFEVAVTTVVILEKKFFSDLNEIWYVGRGRWVMHDGMQHDLIQGQVKVTSPWKSEIWPFSKAISSFIYNGGWQVTTDF